MTAMARLMRGHVTDVVIVERSLRRYVMVKIMTVMVASMRGEISSAIAGCFVLSVSVVHHVVAMSPQAMNVRSDISVKRRPA